MAQQHGWVPAVLLLLLLLLLLGAGLEQLQQQARRAEGVQHSMAQIHN
jgi:hypothetical protein